MILPVDAYLPLLRQTLNAQGCLVLMAEPGAGKTTRVPPAMLADLPADRKMFVLEPRRIAARLAAQRVAEEMGEPLGQTCGYQVRHEASMSDRTRLVFLTEGLLLRKLLGDPNLAEAGLVVVDEFHERHLAGDVCLAVLRRLQQSTRPDLRLMVMSATLDGAQAAAFLGHCPVVEVPGRQYPLTVRYLPHPDGRSIELLMAEAVMRCAEAPGDILAFLPGAAEIRRVREACAGLLNLDVRTLHGDMPLTEQRAAMAAGPGRRLVLATNVAESSVTVPGVQVVIDSGLARVAHHSIWNGLPRLAVERISQASATQRAGRAARVGPGTVLRLYTQAEFDARAPYDVPEVLRADLSETVLELLGAGISDMAGFTWFQPPSAAALETAIGLLERLGALHQGSLTDVGRRMLSLPLHPRLGRMVAEGERLGVGRDAGLVAALLTTRDILLNGRADGREPDSDLLVRVDRFRQAERQGLSPAVCQSLGLDPGGTAAVSRIARQLRPHDARPASTSPDMLLRAVLAGFPDRVGYRPRMEARTVLLSGGDSAELARDSVVNSPWLVAVDVEQRHQQGRHAATLIRLASRIEPDWLIETQMDALREERRIEYHPTLQRVEERDVVCYGSLVLEETTRPAPPGPIRTALLTEAAWRARVQEHASVEALVQRYAFLQTLDATLPPVDLRAALEEVCAPHWRLDEVQAGALVSVLQTRLDPRRQLDVLAPALARLPRRPKGVPIHYDLERPPWLESRLQDFFGLREGPTVAGGRVPVVLHLLAPNGRAMQVTPDLSGFWERTYPQVRRELMRRYPKHAWPENPLRPSAPEARK